MRDVVLVVAVSVFISISAQIAIPLPLVPLTGQDLAVLITGAALGWRLGGLAVLAYLAEGMVGLRVFANGASAWSASRIPGTPYILGTTAGYLIGFVAAAVVVGWLAERGWDRTPWRIATAISFRFWRPTRSNSRSPRRCCLAHGLCSAKTKTSGSET